VATEKGRPLAVVAVLAAAACWATTGTTVVLSLGNVEIDGVTLCLARAGTATALVWFWLGLSRRDLLRLAPGEWVGLAGYGLWAVTLFYIATIYGIAGTSASVGITLLYVAPALVTLGGAVWLGEPLSRGKLAALALSFGGVLLVVRAFSPATLAGTPAGVAWALLAGVAYAGYSLFGKRLLARHRPQTVLAWYLLFGTLGLVAVKLIVSPGSWPPVSQLAAIALGLGVVTTLLPTSLYLFALTRLPSSEASILASIEPVVAVALAAVVLGERLDPAQAAGAGAVVGGVILLNVHRPGERGRRERQTRPDSMPEPRREGRPAEGG